jgi:hypothetical protein
MQDYWSSIFMSVDKLTGVASQIKTSKFVQSRYNTKVST